MSANSTTYINNVVRSADAAQAQNKKAHQFIIKFAWLMVGGMFLDGFVLGYIGALMPSITADLGLSNTLQGAIGAATLIGIFFGSPLGGYLADRFGRRPMFFIDLLIFLVCSIGQFFATDAYTLFLARLFMGIAIGIEYAVAWPMLAEFASPKMRGRLLALTETGWYVGYSASFALSYFMVENHIAHWNLILALSAIPTCILLFLRRGMPESPRWLMSKGRTEEAMAIARKYMAVEEQEDVLNQKHHSVGENPKFFDLFNAKNIKGVTLYSIYFLGTAAPYFSISAFIPMVLQSLGIKDGVFGGLLLNTVAIFGTIAAAFLVDHFSRRTMAIMPFLVSTIALSIVALFSTSPTLILISFLVYSFVNAINAGVLCILPGELIRPEISGLGTGFAAAVSRAGAAFGVFLMPVLISAYGVALVVWIAVAICLFTTIALHKYMPETKGKSMSEIFN